MDVFRPDRNSFNNAFKKIKELNAITAKTYGHNAHNIERMQQMSTDVSNTLENLASASIAKNETLEK